MLYVSFMYIFVVLRILEPSVTGDVIMSYIEDHHKLHVSAMKHDKMREI